VRPEELRERGERLCEELGREAYRAGAGLVGTTRFAEIYRRHSELVGDQALEAARGTAALFEFAVDLKVGREVAALDDRLHAWESAARAVVNGGSIPYQRLWIEIANQPDPARRRELDRARRSLHREPAAIRRERLEREAEVLARCVGGDVVEARRRLSGIDLAALGEEARAFLADTADMYREALGERLRGELELEPGEAERCDSAYLFRGSGFDDVFGGADLVGTAGRQVGEMGLDAEAGGRIHYDTEDRESKRSRAFCAAVRVPEEVYLVIRPHGGFADYRAFWHELGHALHYANVDPDLAFEARWCGDNSVTECYAMLFEHMLQSRPWLNRYVELRGERLRAFRRDQAFALLAIVRRYCGKLLYELSLRRAPTLDSGAGAYAELLSEATGFRYPDEDALLDLDDAFYAARYLRAWQLEALLRSRLIERFDEDWFRNPRAGPALLELFRQGQRDDAALLAQRQLGARLSFAPLARACEAALAS
jgi:hypothetical protein